MKRLVAKPGSDELDDGDKQIYDRQIRAFGEAGQQLLASTKVAVVGVGGTGSPTAEQLVRLGVRDLVLLDPDTLESSNITRVFGAFHKTQMGSKVAAVASHLSEINPEARIRPLPLNVVLDRGCRALLDRDVIFLCTDDHWGRAVVNQVAYQYLIPTLNLGVNLAALRASGFEGVGIVDVLRPDLSCLWCRQFLRSDRVAAESMPAAERATRAREGYVQGVDTPTPSVVSITTTVSGLAVTQFLNLVTAFSDGMDSVERLNYDVARSTVSRGRTTPQETCICKQVRARGDLEALPTVDSLPNR